MPLAALLDRLHEAMKKLSHHWCILVLLSTGLIFGCRQESRQYLLALETKDRLIQKAHKARQDMVDSLGHRDLVRSDQAMKIEQQVQQETLLVDGLLDLHRPRKPNLALFDQTLPVVRHLERQCLDLQDQWFSATGSSDEENAGQISAKIRDAELALAEAYETLKRSQPIGGTTGQVQANPMEQDQG